jgi:hypothetical protein
MNAFSGFVILNFRTAGLNSETLIIAWPISVFPAKAGIQLFQADMDSRFRGNDGVSDLLHIHQYFFDDYKIS